MAEHYTHSENSAGRRHDLVEHLKSEARLLMDSEAGDRK